ncbi:hypothetical protein NIES4071_51520 [Calothrix sp. NIES-4071]|nr:hypothetical protein NIES4071_51520 [Calothrix sp. NIES-4071]BAZ59460.1 hypothetical protein NIES4105_51470 [Calothrix sp. NIES-4105]
MIRELKNYLVKAGFASTFILSSIIAFAPFKPTCSTTKKYYWNNVSIGGGGYVTLPLWSKLIYLRWGYQQ